MFDNHFSDIRDIELFDESSSLPSETPTAKPWDLASVPIPGGDSEKPKANQYDNASVSIPTTTTITADVYNSALSALKKSFKESYELLEMLENTTIVTESVADKQSLYSQDVLLESMESGPIFEAVTREDKNDIKSIVKKIRPEVEKYCNNNGTKLYKPSKLAALFINPVRLVEQLIVEHLWQNLGVLITDDAKKFVELLNDEFKSDLGDYKIVYYKTPASLVDLFRTRFNIKNFKNTYMLLVDKKFPSELKNAIDADKDKLEEGKSSGEAKEIDKK